jgi:type I site-specific restriction endonuclease
MTNEAFSRIKIDAQLRDQGWEITNTNAVRVEYVLPDRTKVDYVLSDRKGRSLAVVEAKKAATNPAVAEAYAAQQAILSIQSQQVLALEKAAAAFPALLACTFAFKGAAAAIHEVEEAVS